MKSIIINILLLLSTTMLITAGEKTDFIVNDDNSIAIQKYPRIAVAADGSFVITWVDRRNDGRDIYLQRFDGEGTPIGRNKLVNDNVTDAYQFEPAIAVDLSGLYSIIWKDYRTSGYPYNPEIYFQRYDSSVSPTGPNMNLSTEYPNSIKESPDIDLAELGGGVIVWADYRNGNWDIFGQIISSEGALRGSNFKINSENNSAQQHAPKVSISSQGWFVVTWYDNRYGHDDIYARRFDSLGNPLSSDIKISNDTQETRQAFCDVATDGAGHFTVVWVDWRNGVYPENPDIYSRKYDTLMTPITDEININTDGSNRAQREPVIAADRMGNVAIIWVDSTGSSWDIAGQMIDVDGVVREENFKANSFTDSLQFSPDVTLDGRYRYLTWTDNRNGNFDIYAAIQLYNEPSLSINPQSLKFEMKYGDIPHSSQKVIVDHFGYNPLPFSISSSVDWLSINPTTGTTPDTLTVSINTDTLPSGVYFGAITFTDTYNNDSSVTISVRLDVYTPTMKLSDDTLYFTVFEGVSEIYSNPLTIQNEWLGQFNWSVSESFEWLTLSSYNGIEWDTIAVDVTPLTLSAGSFIEPLVFISTDAAGSPDTVFLSVEVINDMPYLEVTPDSFFIYSDNVTGFDTTIIIENLGIGTLNWSAQTGHNWLEVDVSSGIANDTLHLTVVDSLLNLGSNISWILFTDNESFNQEVQVQFILNYYNISSDSIKITSTSVETDQVSSVSVLCNLVNPAINIFLPLKYDTTYLTVDSVLPGISHPDILTFSTNIDQLNGQINLSWIVNQPDTFITTGESHLSEIFFTARSQVVLASIDTMISDVTAMTLTTSDNSIVTPSFVRGDITISIPTAVDDYSFDELPDVFELSQNYPNPFNLSTIIKYQLPEKSQVTLEIFNILGQKVKTLVSENQPTGHYEITWNGKSESQNIVSSGIYLYRLKTDNNTLVKKMLLIK